MDNSCCEFFMDNAIPFNAARSRSFKKFMLTCIGPQPVGSHPLVPTGYNPLRCRLLDRLNKTLVDEEQVIRDDWQVTGCTFITDGTTNICGRSLMNYILVGQSKPVFVKCEDVSEGDKDSAAVVAGWKRFFIEWGVEKITAICTDSFAGNTSAARMLREDPEFAQIYWIPCTTHCMDLLMHDIGKKEWADEIITKANKIVNFVRVHRWPRSQLRTQLSKYPDLKCTCLLRPAQTRFMTNYVMLQRLEVCERVIVRIVTGHGWEAMPWRGDIRVKAYFVEETVLDKALWADVKKLIAVMKGPYGVLRKVDKDVHCLSRIYDMAYPIESTYSFGTLVIDQLIVDEEEGNRNAEDEEEEELQDEDEDDKEEGQEEEEVEEEEEEEEEEEGEEEEEEADEEEEEDDDDEDSWSFAAPQLVTEQHEPSLAPSRSKSCTVQLSPGNRLRHRAYAFRGRNVT
ncbi:hypothetical protein CBR_g50605 [Chara braunii]|uniref:DUF659 domain-containing protein n=1 Tax=Chara braunii TaxID=69332 RepID=A0A388M6Z2_CHABU|nr:hypothetical protein CBR_g50605 [Chara braunii]|eukprot:GBG90357.1 hypothetical protein CBR_g50605 [Chara braunii]